MKLLAPKYYKEFKCIADRCRHSCCVGWEIDVDADSMEKYSTLCGGYSEKIRESIEMGETPHFRLAENEKCPHLDECGLCRIISEYGEGFLCDICREHPRFYNDTALGKEVGIGLSCEEAARIILSSDSYNEFYIVEELGGEVIDAEFDAVECRERLYDILANRSLAYTERLEQISSEFEVRLTDRSDGKYRELLSSLEYLDEVHKTMFCLYSSNLDTPKEYEKVLERALAYFIYRHCSGAYDAEEFLAALGFSLFCERLLASLLKANGATTMDEIADHARIVSEEIEYSEENTEKILSKFYI